MRHPFPKSTKENGHQKLSGDRGVYNRKGTAQRIYASAIVFRRHPDRKIEKAHRFIGLMQCPPLGVVTPQSGFFIRSVYEDKVFREGCNKKAPENSGAFLFVAWLLILQPRRRSFWRLAPSSPQTTMPSDNRRGGFGSGGNRHVPRHRCQERVCP